MFSPAKHRIDGIEYDVAYALADSAVGGDIVDVYHFDNGNVAFAIADISGKGTTAAIDAALVKYGLRCYASAGLTAERVLRELDRTYIENNAFERSDSFASVFFAILDHERRALAYGSAGHEPVMLVRPDGQIDVLAPTAPLIGVFDDQHHLFTQRVLDIESGTVLFATTDGVTEARNSAGDMFGMERLISAVRSDLSGGLRMNDLIASVLKQTRRFAGGQLHDDIAVIAVRIL